MALIANAEVLQSTINWLSNWGWCRTGAVQTASIKSSECCLVFVIPIKLPSLHAVSNKCIERCSQDAKSSDIHLIKVQEAEECPNFFQCRGSLPVHHTLDLDWVHSDGVFADNHAKVLHFGGFELAFLGFHIEIIVCEDAQHIVDYMVV